jgi:hypothetical protein
VAAESAADRMALSMAGLRVASDMGGLSVLVNGPDPLWGFEPPLRWVVVVYRGVLATGKRFPRPAGGSRDVQGSSRPERLDHA